MPSAKMAPMIIARNSNNTPINANGDKPKKPQQLQSTSYENGVDPSHQPSLKPAPRSINHTKPPMPESSSASAPVGRRPVPARRHVPPRATSSNSLPGSVASALLIQPNNVCRVIKGEIHNVLNVLRADSRYVSPLRFMEEIPSDEQHPLLLQLREIHATLSEWELLNHQQQPEARMYLPPFCSAIQGRDISASVTGAALNAIHKFLLYGFLSFEGPEAFATIANTLLLCTFEESEDATPASGPRQRNLNSVTDNRDDEQVVLKLLDLSALVVRCASQSLEAELIVGLLDTCLHVSHRAKRASPLLKSAASDALGQIVLQVFSQGDNMVHAREAILANLASLLNPQQNSESYVVNSLTLVNIALETLRVELSPNEITILSNDLCKYLLHWSTTHDLVILSLTLRVIFNLFQTIRNHLKVPLEVFLTSVHLRILEHSASNEEREVALESLLEFCQEPALMKDLYLNYDCDVQCTNLYESICATLGNVAAPNSFCVPQVQLEMDNSLKDGPIAKTAIAQKAAAAAAEVPLNALNILALEGLTTIISSIARRCNNKNNSEAGSVSSGGESVDDDLVGEQVTEEDLQERKRKKFALTKIAKAFNSNPTGKDWLKLGKDLSILDETAECIAKMLHTAPGIDKNQIGLYLAKGPAEKYPFEHEVRVAFVKEYDFKGMHFAQALRLYLSKFRMPGEAQCIDRFMDSFSRELYRQQAEESVFKNSDAIFVLAFSTIMLNTDLHNPTIKNVSRMTCVQFIRNNRGLNNGEDLPEDMLKGLYTSIKESEIQLQRDIGEFISHAEPTHRASEMRAAWDDLLSKNVATALFTTVDEARRTMYQAGVHEKDMFLTIAKPAMKALSSAFVRSWDDGTVVDALKGFEQMAKISTYFGLDNLLNEILTFLLNHGRDYINGCISLEYAGIDSGAPINQSPEDDETMSIVDPDSPLPHVLLKVREYLSVDYKRVDISGAAAYRGLLALNMGLKIVRALFPRVREAWPSLIEVLCGLRDARALPAGLADLDDFADSDGNVLPLSPFAKQSQKRMDDFYRGEPGQDSTENQGWLGRIGLFRRGVVQAEEHESETDPMPDKKASNRGELTANSKTLLQIAERADVEKFMQLSPKTRLPIVKQSIVRLLENVDKFPKKDSPTYEQHTAFALELAARALLASRDRAIELLPLFLAKFDSVASKIKGKEELPVPFLVERVVVTILRTSIHLYGVPQSRAKLRNSLFSLSVLPKDTFVQHIADRMACGLAIILRSSFYLFKTSDEWKFLGDTFDVLSYFPAARGLVFDGIASTIEAALPQISSKDLDEYETKLRENPTLSVPGATALQRNLFKYVYGVYQKDFALSVPAMLCLEKLYKHLVKMLMILQRNDLSRDPSTPLDSIPDRDLWQRAAVAFYSVCCSTDPDSSKLGWECFQRHVLTTDVSQIADEKWIAILNLIIQKQPPIEADVARMNTFSVFGEVMILILPSMTQREKNWKTLTEQTKRFAILADQNIHHGRQGGVKPMFEYTVQTLTYLSNEMASTDFGGEKRYCAWASETLLTVLERAGAAGGAVKNKALTQKATNGEAKDGASAQNADGESAQNTDGESAQNADGAIAESGDRESAQNAEGESAQNADEAIAESGDRESAQNADGESAQNADGESAQNADEATAQSGVEESAQNADGESAQNVDGESAQNVDGVSAQSAEGASAQSAEGASAQNAEE